MAHAQTHEAIAATLRKATAALRDAGIPFMLGGSVACWARGGPRSQNDLDLLIKPADAERALQTLVDIGMRPERPPEEWLFKAWDGEVMIDLMCRSLAFDRVTDEVIDAAEEMSVLGISMRVMASEDVLVGKLLAVSEQNLDYAGLVEIARGLREQLDWAAIRSRTEASPYGRAFFALLAELGVVDPGERQTSDRADTAAGVGRNPTPVAASLSTAKAVRSTAGVCVFAPAPLLTVTVEPGKGDTPEIHLHAGGQGFWVARMAALVGEQVTMCSALGGESGGVLRGLIEAADVDLHAVDVQAANGAYVHDRRNGERRVIAENVGERLSRHEADELYGAALAAGLRARVTVLTGTAEGVIDADVYRRLAADLAANDVTVVADLTGGPLDAALEGGLHLLKLSAKQLVEHELATSTDDDAVFAAMEKLQRAGSENVVVTRAEQPALARIGPDTVEVTAPSFEAVEWRGTGDSFCAATAVALAEGAAIRDALRLGMAAGAINAARHGLGSGQRKAIDSLLEQVRVRPVAATAR